MTLGDASSLPRDVVVTWLTASTSTTDALAALGCDAAGHACPRCGSDAHGRPWGRVGDAPVAASASRAGEHLVLVTRAGDASIGVDVEASDASVDPSVVLHPDEVGLDPLETWVAKEAILKHLGAGLRADPTTIRVTDFPVGRIAAPEGFVAAVCTSRFR